MLGFLIKCLWKDYMFWMIHILLSASRLTSAVRPPIESGQARKPAPTFGPGARDLEANIDNPT